MPKRKLRKKAEINPPQSPHDGIHTCSKGCNKPGCTRALRDTIEEQDKQIEALKRDVLEQAVAVRQLRFERIYDFSEMGGQCEEIARLRSVAEDNKRECEATRIENARLKAEVERLTAIVGADAIDREHGMCCDASAQVERLTKALAFSNSVAKDLYGMLDLRMSKKDLIGIGFTKKQADEEWEAYRASANAAKEGKQS